jgi:hemerythrin-like domain-containing protein
MAGGEGSPNPLDDGLGVFRHCHAGILEHIDRLRRLPVALAARGARDALADLSREAGEIADFFRREVYEHHQQEEGVLFAEMRRAAPRAGETALVDALCNRLTQEHRGIEEAWERIEPSIRRLAEGWRVELDEDEVNALAVAYAAHAQFEEAVVLPMSTRLLSDGDKAALGLQLHLRHLREGWRGYYV